MWLLFQAIHVPLIVFYTRTPTGIGMAKSSSSEAEQRENVHLLKPLARENAQPSEDYVCTIQNLGTSKTMR